MIIAQSSIDPEALQAVDEIQREPVGGPGATPIMRVRPVSRNAAMAVHTASLV